MQLAFITRILYKDCDNKGSGRVKLIKIDLKPLIVDTLYIEVWSKVLIFAASVSVSIMSVCLVKACFSIFLYVFKVKSGITPRYIVICREVVERLTSGKKLLSKLLLSSTLCKQYWECTRLAYLRHSIISADLQW